MAMNTFIAATTKFPSKLLLYAPKFQPWGGVLSSWMGIRNQSTESIDIQTTENEVEKKRKRTCDFVDQPRPRFYGFQGWRMYKDYNKRMCVKEHFATRMRLNAVRKNAILPQALREEAHREVELLPRDSNPIRVRRRCVITSRPRGIQRKWRVSRIMWKHFAETNMMSGVTRATW